MGSSLPVLTRTAKEADEGVAIPRCALMASSSLEVLENSSVITFSSDRRQRGFMVHRPPGHPQSFIRYWTLCWRYMDNPRKSCRMQINYALFNALWGVKTLPVVWPVDIYFFLRYAALNAKPSTAFILLRAHQISQAMFVFRSFILYHYLCLTVN